MEFCQILNKKRTEVMTMKHHPSPVFTRVANQWLVKRKGNPAHWLHLNRH